MGADTVADGLERALDALEDLVVVVEPGGRVVHANRAYRDAFGAAGERGALCSGWPAGTPPADPLEPPAGCPARVTLATGRPCQAILTRYLECGAVRVMDITARPVHDGDGRVVAAVEVARDVTQRRALDSELRQAQKMEALATLAGGVAHDFNNILFGMLGFVELIRMDLPDGSEGHASLRQLVRSIERARTLVSQVQAFGRRTDAEFVPLDLAGVLTDLAAIVRAQLPPGIELRVLAEGPAPVEGDSGQLAKAVTHLAQNAALSMERGGVVEIALSRLHADADFVRAHPSFKAQDYLGIAVSDTGVGIAPDVTERLFEPFFTTREFGRGTGLGLAVVHGVVTAHGGTITVHSEAGRGTTFRVFLPQLGPAAPDEADDAALEGSPRLLVADVNALAAEMYRETLARRGCAVTARATGEDALAAVLAAPLDFDLVVIDDALPGTDALAFAGEVRRLRPGLPIIVTTGLALARHALEAGAPGIVVLQKPVTPRELARAVRLVARKG